MAKKLIIVESPSKARTISKFLGNEYVVLASFGHIMDLPRSTLGFDPDNDFKPEYNVTKDKIKVVRELMRNLERDTIVYLASDSDREGALIAKHLKDVLKVPDERTVRLEFHEITKRAIMEAIANPSPLNTHLADAAIARRVLDRAIGYKLSPLLWMKIKGGLSAGRVQSVALRMVSDREEEINAHVPEEFWKLKLDVLTDPSFKAELELIDGKKSKVTDSVTAYAIKDDCDKHEYVLEDVIENKTTRNPAAPFTTSTLQQEASLKLGISPKVTMQIAQKLYEGGQSLPNHTGGLITYMRTDSVTLSKDAVEQSRSLIQELYGADYTLAYPRVFKNKSANAQEAHEAIRPVDMNIKPSYVKDFVDETTYRLYSLIWSRTMASQMAEAKVATTTFKIKGGSNKQYTYIAKGVKILFPGFMKAYVEDDHEDSDDSKEKILPNVSKGTKFTHTKLSAEQNFTKPPGRYSEASLIKKLEADGIGRPSTYAATLSTIINRGYVTVVNKRLHATTIGTVVTNYLKEHFPDIVDYKFTAGIETEFDKIANGESRWQAVMTKFYQPFIESIESKMDSARVQYSRSKLLGVADEHNVYVKEGQHGIYIQLGESDKANKIKPVRISPVPKNILFNDITLEDAMVYLSVPRVLGKFKDADVSIGVGRFGPYFYCKGGEVCKHGIYFTIRPRDEIDIYTVTIDRATTHILDALERQANNTVLEFDSDVYKHVKVMRGKYGYYINILGVKGTKIGKMNIKLPNKHYTRDARSITKDEVIDVIQKSIDDSKSGKKKLTKKK